MMIVEMRVVVPQLQTDIIYNRRAVQGHTQIHLTVQVAAVRVSVTIGCNWWIMRHTVNHPETRFVVEGKSSFGVAARKELFSCKENNSKPNNRYLQCTRDLYRQY